MAADNATLRTPLSRIFMAAGSRKKLPLAPHSICDPVSQ
jgi:hypothetical protein